MNNSKIKINYMLKRFFYLLLFISVILFSIKFYKITNISSVIILIIVYLALFFISSMLYLLQKFLYDHQIIKKSNKIKTFIKIDLIILFILNTFIYYVGYDTLHCQFYKIIVYSIVVTSIVLSIINRYLLKPIIIPIVTGLIVFFASYILGALAATDFSLASFIFLFGLVFTVIENIEKFINLDVYYPKEITTLENDEIIKRNKVTLNLIIGVLFMLSYVILKLLTIQHIQDKLLIILQLNVFNRNIGVGLLIIIAIEVLIILSLFISTRILEKISNHTKKYDNQTIVGLMYSILTFGIKEDKLPKVVKKIAIGNKDIDQINLEVFIENIKEVPKDIHILLSKAEDVSIIRKLFPKKDVPTIRKLLVIYPNKKVYSCEISISKNIAKRISEVRLEDTINK